MLFLSALLSAILSCARTESSLPAPPPPYQVEQQISRDFIIIRDSYIKSYLAALSRRLVGEFSNQIYLNLAESRELFAKSFPAGQILISSALALECRSEAELAFIVAHEISHIFLGHHNIPSSALGTEQFKNSEIQADALGTNLLLTAGYPINGAKSSIQRFNSVLDFFSQNTETAYPSTAERLALINNQFMQHPCLINGTCIMGELENSREFVKFISKLSKISGK